MSGSRDETVRKLREISTDLEADPLSEIKKTLFPGWHPEYEGSREELVKEAAGGILAQNISPDDGTYVSQKAIAALINYIADMME